MVLHMPLLRAGSRALATTASVLVADSDINELELESLSPLPAALPADLVPSATAQGRACWPRPSMVRLLRE
eukprot:8580924-Pyramimonas_sp.AAC.1